MNIFRLFLVFFNLSVFSQITFDKVVIWGHPLHSHTHSYIHHAFYKTFEYLKYKTYHLENIDHPNFDFSRTLFITEGQVDSKIPIRSDCYYILHNCDIKKYKHLLDSNHVVCIQVYTNKVKEVETAKKIRPFFYEDYSNKTFYMPWATDLLPHEIEYSKQRLKRILSKKEKKYIAWNGTFSSNPPFDNASEINPFKVLCEKNGIAFFHKIDLNPKQVIEFIQNSYLAPTIVGSWQKQEGYIPCRIFKNISYGQLGITNSKEAAELFFGKIIYSDSTEELFHKAIIYRENPDIQNQLFLMDVVQKHHTYINRIDDLLSFFNKMNNI